MGPQGWPFQQSEVLVKLTVCLSNDSCRGRWLREEYETLALDNENLGKFEEINREIIFEGNSFGLEGAFQVNVRVL